MLLFTLSRRYTVPCAIYILRFNAELKVDTVPSSRACGKSLFEELSTATALGGPKPVSKTCHLVPIML